MLWECYQTQIQFICPMYSEAKQTKVSELEAKKGLLQDQAGRTGSSC